MNRKYIRLYQLPAKKEQYQNLLYVRKRIYVSEREDKHVDWEKRRYQCRIESFFPTEI